MASEKRKPRAKPAPPPAEEPSGLPPLSPEHRAVLDKIAAGEPLEPGGRKPGLREVLGALRLIADFTVSKPRSEIDHRIGIVLVQDPYSQSTDKLNPGTIAVPVNVLPEPEDEDEL